jgi:hypothetical protein
VIRLAGRRPKGRGGKGRTLREDFHNKILRELT